MVDRKQAPNAPEAITFKVELERRLFCFVIIAERSGSGRVLTATLLALKTLAAHARKAGFDLTRCVLAMGTNNHVKRYTIVCFDLDSPVRSPALTNHRRGLEY